MNPEITDLTPDLPNRGVACLSITSTGSIQAIHFNPTDPIDVTENQEKNCLLLEMEDDVFLTVSDAKTDEPNRLASEMIQEDVYGTVIFMHIADNGIATDMDVDTYIKFFRFFKK